MKRALLLLSLLILLPTSEAFASQMYYEYYSLGSVATGGGIAYVISVISKDDKLHTVRGKIKSVFQLSEASSLQSPGKVGEDRDFKLATDPEWRNEEESPISERLKFHIGISELKIEGEYIIVDAPMGEEALSYKAMEKLALEIFF